MILANEMDKKIYQEEFANVLPDKIFDAHVHIFEKAEFPENFEFPEQSCYKRFGGEFSLALWHELMHELLPGHEVYINCFGVPDLHSDHDWVPQVNHQNEFSMVLVSPADKVEDLARRVENSKAVGVKPYLDYAAHVFNKKANDVEILDMLSAEQLDYINKKGLAITLHIPRSGRFADVLNQRQMVDLCGRYSNIKFIFAHIGRAYFMRNIKESNIEELAQYSNAYVDTAMINNPDIIKYACDHFPAGRILFGSDAPIALLRGKSVEINNQYAYLMGENYKIGTAILDTENIVKFTTFFYEQLRAVIAAADSDTMNKIFFDNAYKLFTGIKQL